VLGSFLQASFGMTGAIWIAAALGLTGGIVVSWGAGRLILPRLLAGSLAPLLAVRLAFAGAVIALVPAILLSIVVGGTLGSAWGAQLFRLIGVPASGFITGHAVGMSVVFALVLLGGAVSGILLARAVVWYRRRGI